MKCIRLLAILVNPLFALQAFAQEAVSPPRTSLETSSETFTACTSRHRALAEGPVGIGYGDVDFATGRRACPRTEVGLGIQAGAIIDTPDFYGDIAVGGRLFGSLALTPHLELFAALEAAHLEYAQNASLKGTRLSLGQATLGGTYVAYQAGPLAVSPSARLLLPTATGTSVRTVGAELGVAATLRANRSFEFHGYAGANFSAGLSPAAAFPRVGVLALAGLQYSPCSGFAAALDVDAHFLSVSALDYLAPQLALRFRFSESLGLEIAGSLPLAGTDRHDGLVGLKLTHRL